MIENNIFSLGSKKLLQFRSHLEKWVSGCSIQPITLEIQPSERCNHHCTACQSQYSLPRKETLFMAKSGLDLDLSTLDSIWERPPSGVVLSGNTGDPLMHPAVGTLLETLHKKKIPTVLIKNGQNLNPIISKQILKSCQGVRISLDAHDETLYNQTHGVNADSWNKVLNNVKELISIRKESGLVEENCTIGFGYLTGEQTTYGMVDATKLARNMEVDYIQFRPFHFSNKDVTKFLLNCEKYETEKFHVYSSNQKYTQLNLFQRNYLICHGAWFYTVIDARADMYLCCHHVGNPNALIGSLHNSSWSELLTSKHRHEKICSFDVSGCLPLCRLDSHNRMLDSIKTSNEIPEVDLGKFISKHAHFL